MIECYKRFVSLILCQLVVEWIGKAHGPTKCISHKNWLCIGDFNQIVSIEDKFGFKHRKVDGAESLRQTLFELELCELVAKGQKFTWMNEHEDDSFIMERLENAYASIEWINAYPHYDLRKQPILRSDHGSIVLNFKVRQPFRKRPFRFERMWLTHADCKNVAWSAQANGSRAFKFQQKLKNIRSKFTEWNRSVFGRVENELKDKQRKSQEVQNSISTTADIRIERELRGEIETLLHQEEIMWAQKARSNWAIYGDRITRSYQTVVKQRRARNRIVHLKSANGDYLENLEEIEHLLVEHFQGQYHEFENRDVQSILQELEHSHQLMEKIPSILHKKPTFSILHHYFYKTPTSVYLFYKTIQ